MGRFRLSSIAELARQMTFTPSETRALQLRQAEDLLHSLAANTAYPLEFVVFRITGYHPRHAEATPELLTGLALQHDLGLLIERVSETMNLSVDATCEPVLSIQDACERLSVTSKTVQRWRRRGLPSRRFVFPDGKRRVGFLLSSVERFFSAHRDQVGANVTVVSENETALIIARATRLVREGRCCDQEVTRRIGRMLNRSPATILHIIRKHDAEHPDQAVFAGCECPAMADATRAIILKGHRRGIGFSRLERKTGRNRSAIYRVLLDERLARLGKRKVKFIDDPLYHDDQAEQMLQELASADAMTDKIVREESTIPRDLPPYMQQLYRIPLLTAARERALFLQFNYYRFRFVSMRRKFEPELARLSDVKKLEATLHQATQVKNQIVAANLRLVVNVAAKHVRAGVSLMDLISEGNLILMRAAESFDVHKGNRFSTYATLALMKGFARTSVQLQVASRKALWSERLDLHELADTRSQQHADRFIARDHVRSLISQLDDREQAVIRRHFGLDENTSPASFDELAAELNLSAARIRQIKQMAIEKLRQAK